MNTLLKKGRAPLFLLPLSRVWGALLRLRHFAYDAHLLPIYKASIPTFSIGNIAVGGTGKTPLVHLLANTLQDTGNVAILTRGYKSKLEKSSPPVQISTGQGPLFPAAICGDEPFFLAENTQAAVWVGANRRVSAELAHAAGADCLLLDDGMQHRKLARDVEIVVVDASSPFGNGRLLPAGILRDLPERLRGADLIVATHVESLTHYEEIKKQLSAYTPAPVVAMQHVPHNAAAVQQRKVGGFCGIGQPDHFFKTLSHTGATLVATLALKDHEAISATELAAFAAECEKKGAEMLVCTEKDWVKLPTPLTLNLPLVPLQIRLEIVAGQEHWDAAVNQMKSLMRKS